MIWKDKELITIVVPTYNEEENIKAVLRQLISKNYDSEVIVVDGMSTDNTRKIVSGIAVENPRIRMIDNPARIQSIGVNLAAEQASQFSKYLLRADAHCDYPEGWVDNVVGSLTENGATSCVVPMLTVGKSGTQAAIAFAQNSKLGNGGSSHRNSDAVSGWIDHGHHAIFLKEFFIASGGYDANFAVNEDAEFDLRTAKIGAKVWMNRDAVITYYPRKTIHGLVGQYFRYGSGRAMTFWKHRTLPRLRQLMPAVATAGVAGSLLLGVLIDSRFLLIADMYFLLIAAYIFFVCGDRSTRFRVSVFLAMSAMHLSWGAGFLFQLCRITIRDALNRIQ